MNHLLVFFHKTSSFTHNAVRVLLYHGTKENTTKNPFLPLSLTAKYCNAILSKTKSFEGGLSMEIRKVETTQAPAAIGPYSQAVDTGNLVFVSGCLPADPATGDLAEAVIETQTARALDNLKAVLEAAGCSLSQVVKTTVFLSDMGNFAAMNGVYTKYFDGEVKPARSAVEVAALPKGAMVEIEAIAAK